MGWRGRLAAHVSWRTFAGVALSILLFEIALRQLAFGAAAADPDVNRMLGPQRRRVVFRLNEGFGVANFEADGPRVRPSPPVAGPRILFVGDSLTRGLQVEDDEVFTSHVPNSINVGQRGHSAAHHIALAPEYLARHEPAWTVIQLSSEDLGWNAFSPGRTHFDESLRVVPVSRRFARSSRLLMNICSRSAFVDYAWLRWQRFSEASQRTPIFRAADADRLRALVTLPVDESVPVERILERLVDAYGNRVTLLYLVPFRSQPDRTEQRVMRFCVKRAMSCINARSMFDDYRHAADAPTGFPNYRFAEGHLNRSGHAAVGRLVNQELKRLHARGLF